MDDDKFANENNEINNNPDNNSGNGKPAASDGSDTAEFNAYSSSDNEQNNTTAEENAENDNRSQNYGQTADENNNVQSEQPNYGQPPVDGSYNYPPQNNNQYGGEFRNPYSNNQYPGSSGANGGEFRNSYSNNPYSGNNGGNGNNGYYPQNGNNGDPNKPKTKKKNTGLKVFIIVIAVIAVAAIIAMVALFNGNDKSGKDNSNSTEVVSSEDNGGNSSEKKGTGDGVGISAKSSSSNSTDATGVYEKASKYNVGIMVYQNGQLGGEGSGVLAAEKNGKTYVITCAHVINYSNVSIKVLMSDGTEYDTKTVGLDSKTDIGVLSIEKTGLTIADFADSDDLVVGQKVYAIGNPGGSEFYGSFTDGMISAIGRPISSDSGYVRECIQHTAAINPGNSGGALVNEKGEVIGINSAKIASTEYEGMGFAVPSNVVIEVFNSIVKNGYVTGRAKLGISYTTPAQYSQYYSMYVQMSGLPSGSIVIAAINDDSDLKNYDVQVGDLITQVNGKDLDNTDALAEAIEKASVGDEMELTIVRIKQSGNKLTHSTNKIKVKLVEDTSTGAADETTTKQQSDEEDFYNYFNRYFNQQGGSSDSGSGTLG